MQALFNQLFFLRKSKGKEENHSTIYLRITVGGVRTEISMQKNCDLKKWNAQSGRINGKTEGITSVNTFLITVEHRIYEIQRTLIEKGSEISGEKIKNIFLGIVERPKMLTEIYQDHNDQFEALVGKDVAIGTFKKIQNCSRFTKKFY